MWPLPRPAITGFQDACLQPVEDAIDVHWPFHRHRSNNPQTLKHVVLTKVEAFAVMGAFMK